MTPWMWFAGCVGDDAYELAEEGSREAVIKAAMRELAPGETFQIIEARMSTAAKYEGWDFVPFLRTRNHEIVTASRPSHASEG